MAKNKNNNAKAKNTNKVTSANARNVNDNIGFNNESNSKKSNIDAKNCK